MIYSSDGVAREADLKDYILRTPTIFGNLGKSVVIFEKAITSYSVIADCLIFSELKGIIGIEIKTENDSTKRLNKQLNAYKAIADFAWVICHDKHVDKVLKIIDKYDHKNVGVISYLTQDGEIYAGVIRDANTSPYKDSRVALGLLWKPELLAIANVVKNGYTYSQLSLQNYYTRQGEAVGSAVTRRMNKAGIIDFIIGMLGAHQASQLVCDMFIAHDMHPEKVLKYYHFKEVK